MVPFGNPFSHFSIRVLLPRLPPLRFKDDVDNVKRLVSEAHSNDTLSTEECFRYLQDRALEYHCWDGWQERNLPIGSNMI